jgi:tetratricopeptide (TPR) repeat protein
MSQTIAGEGRKRWYKTRSVETPVKALKEWGGAATLMIALLYTFPFDAFDRFTKWRDSDVLAARQVLSDAATISIEFAKTPKELQNDPNIVNLYQAKFGNLIYSNRDALVRAAPLMETTEIRMIAAYLANIGQMKQSLQYYEIALAKARRDGLSIVMLLTEIAQVHYASRNPAEGRKLYKEAVELSANADPPDLRRQVGDLADLAYLEKQSGDWDCGQSLQQQILPSIQKLVSIDPLSRTYFARHQSAMVQPRGNQPGLGCPDLLKLAPELPEYMNAFPAIPSAFTKN